MSVVLWAILVASILAAFVCFVGVLLGGGLVPLLGFFVAFCVGGTVSGFIDRGL